MKVFFLGKVLLMLMLTPNRVSADNRSDIYNAYVINRMDQWKEVIDRMESTDQKSNVFLLELVNYQYGYIGYCLGFDKKSEARKYLAMAEINTSTLEKSGYRLPVLNAYRSALYAFRITLNPISAPFNGPKSLDHARKAVEEPDNYFGNIQMGNAYFYMPSAFGGSKQKAFEFYSRARNIMEKDPSLTRGNWNYLSLLVTIAQSHSYLGEFDSAKSEYENILKIEPGFLYVKNDLYPKLLSRMRQ